MDTTVTQERVPLARATSADADAGAAARAARRWFLIVAPVLAGLLAIVGAAADPAAGEDGRVLYEAYANEPDRVQIKAFAYHFAYALWLAAALLLAGLVRRRGSWIANVAGVLALLGITTMPGFVAVDFVDSAVGQLFGVEGAVQVNERAEGMWALVALASTGGVGFILALPLAAVAAWRGGLIPWWAPVAVAAGIFGGFGFLGATVAGTAVLTAAFAVFSVALARVDRDAWGGLLRAEEARPSTA